MMPGRTKQPGTNHQKTGALFAAGGGMCCAGGGGAAGAGVAAGEVVEPLLAKAPGRSTQSRIAKLGW